MIVDIMQVITVIVNIYISFTEKKKKIYIATFLLNLSQLFMYFFNNDITTGLIYIIIVVRSLIYIYKDKLRNDIIPYVIIVIQVLVGMFTLTNTLQILSIVIACYSSWYLWFYNDTQKLRIGNVIANSAWSIYNICQGLYIIIIMRVITILSNLIAYIERRKVKRKCQKE